MKKLSTIISVFFLFIISLQAQSPQAFNYQGVARDASGNPYVNTQIGIRISLLSNNPNGPVAFVRTP
jgi:hypothetical protein